MDDQDIQDVLQAIEREVTEIVLQVDTVDVDDLFFEVESVAQKVILLETVLPDVSSSGLVPLVLQMVSTVQALVDDHHRNKLKGRHEIPISEEQITVLLDYHFTVPAIADIFGVSTRTVRRRIAAYGLEDYHAFCEISDAQLDTIVHHFVETHPNSGQRCLEGFLRSKGVRLQRQRVRDALKRFDPRGVESRLRRTLHRRQYSVCMPNSLWHIDGNHKLIRWRIVIHGGVDGYSRLPVFLRASANNLSDTMLRCFLDGVHHYGLPSRVRCDWGVENVRVSEFMLNHPERGPGRGSCITGRSVHNQRIERFWRNLFIGCVSLFYHLFYMLEDMRLLNHDNPNDLFALHYVFLPRVNRALDIFRESYSHHPVRTAGNRSPYQLWMAGLVRGDHDGDSSALQGVLEEPLVS